MSPGGQIETFGGHSIRNNPCSFGGMPRMHFRTVHRTYISLAAAGLLLMSHAADAQHRKGMPASPRSSVTAPVNQQMLATQVALDRAGFSAGEIDGVGGAKTR